MTPKQKAFAEAKLDGASNHAANKIAGYASTNPPKSKEVAEYVAQARQELQSTTQIKRAEVLEMLVRSYELAELAGEPATMVSAAREIGKMLGYYEPETIKLELTNDQARLKSKFTSMSEAELLEIAEGSARIIDGEFTRLS